MVKTSVKLLSVLLLAVLFTACQHSDVIEDSTISESDTGAASDTVTQVEEQAKYVFDFDIDEIDLTTLDKSGIGPVAANGQLQVIGTQLSNEKGEPVWLRGMSSHGLQWYGHEINEESLDILAYNWKVDMVRISLYAREGGYNRDPEHFTEVAEQKIQMAIDRGLYVIIDWHQLDPGDPNEDIDNAITYLTHMAEKFGDTPNVIYEIANEPNKCEWSDVKEYAEKVIPIIREIDPDGVILVGTHGWGSLGLSDGENEYVILNNPVEADNIMYTFHFYAASHSFEYYGLSLKNFAENLPVFVSECGTQTYTGDGKNDFFSSDQYFDMFEEMKISWINWNFSSDKRSGAVLRRVRSYDKLKKAGYYIRNRILEPANSWD